MVRYSTSATTIIAMHSQCNLHNLEYNAKVENKNLKNGNLSHSTMLKATKPNEHAALEVIVLTSRNRMTFMRLIHM